MNHVANAAPPALHDIKVIPPYMDALINGSKTWELRNNDRGYQRGDNLLLREWHKARPGEPDCRQCERMRLLMEPGHYTDRAVNALIGFVYSGDPRFDGLAPGHVILSLLEVRAAS